MERAYSKFATELVKAIRRRYDEGDPALINQDMQKLVRRYDIEYQYANDERRKIENQLMNNWINDRTLKSDNKIGSYEGRIIPLNPPSKGEMKENPLVPKGEIRKEVDSFATMQSGFKREIKRVVDRGLRNQISLQQITELIKRAANIGSAKSRTVARTAKMGQIRGKYLLTHIKAGCKKFRYAGVSGAAGTVSSPRDFCMKHLGKIYTIEEILKLDNGQGLSVLLYMGGWNCRHRWEAVYENDELGNREKPVKIGKTELISGAKPKPHEYKTADKLNIHGFDIAFMPESQKDGKKMYDAILNNKLKAEFKSAANVKSVENHASARLKEAIEKGADCLVWDITQEDYDIAKAILIWKRKLTEYENIQIKTIIILENDKIEIINTKDWYEQE